MREQYELIIILMTLMTLLPTNVCYLPFASYTTQFSKSYTPGSAQYNLREGYYVNLGTSATTLESTVSYTIGENKYWDTSPEQQAKLMRSVKTQSNPSGDKFQNYKTGGNVNTQVTENIDWNLAEKVTSVKNQGDCGSAWDFSVVGMCQSSLILKESQNFDFSEQQVLQCTSSSSCSGGYVEKALETAVNFGLSLESTFAYNPSSPISGICNQKTDLTFSSSTFFKFYNLTDAQVKSLLGYGPIVAHVSAQNWIYYKSGILQCSDNSPVAHAVLLTGATDTYWIAKNSWGSDWGQSGYIRISRNLTKNCGIGTAVFALKQSNNLVLIVCLFILLALF